MSKQTIVVDIIENKSFGPFMFPESAEGWARAYDKKHYGTEYGFGVYTMPIEEPQDEETAE